MAEHQDKRRKSKRYKVNWQVRLLFANRKIFTARARDVSLGGVGFDFEHQIPVGKEVSLELGPWLNGKQVFIRAKGAISYSMILGNNAGFSFGVKFTMIPRDQFEILCDILKTLDLQQ